ncbi:histidinol-phosphate transaminase [Thermomonas sp.]|uniref:histidinol-phosphate transaminase n=1 Tax=Thermomonas sp. TaxID=1971895 RepID=UPI002488DE5B|nr:histidinol-phosphate transaminase [Thermomonas sp.]MDI1252952.1 histidinol-phosphate transaminase [Thermomonas sp.]
MSTVSALLRSDLRDFGGYRSARSDKLDGDIWLNANESPWANPGTPASDLRRYPSPQPQQLRDVLAGLYLVTPEQVLAGRGSDEAIDLLQRAFCMPGQDRIVIAPPVFGMYAVCARLHGTAVIEVPLVDGAAGLNADLDAMVDAVIANDARLLFLCSPGNPSGEALSLDAIAVVAERLRNRAVVVVDEAYAEFSEQPSATALLDAHDNLAILRTLSKAHALAAARIGCVIGSVEMIDALRRCQAPYPIPQPCADVACEALSGSALEVTRQRVREICSERAVVAVAMVGLPGVRRVYASQGNFLLARFDDAEVAFQRLLQAGVVVRDMRSQPQLGDALRITIGSPEQNLRVLEVLAQAQVEAA